MLTRDRHLEFFRNIIGSKNATFKDYSFFWYHGFIATVVCFIKTIHWREKLFCITLILFSSITIMPGNYFFGHYWIMVLPGVSILAGITFFAITSTIKTRMNIKSLAPQYIYLSVFLLITFFHVLKLNSYYFKPDYFKILRSSYGENPFPESMEIANYINANIKPNDQIVLIGSEPQLYFYTKKECPSRHAYFGALVDDIPEHKQWQREFAADIEKAKPRYIVYFNHSFSLNVQYNTDNFIFDWADKYINENYKRVALVVMTEGQKSFYFWNTSLGNYKPKDKNSISIYERNLFK